MKNIFKNMSKQMKMSDETLNELYEKINTEEKPIKKSVGMKFASATAAGFTIIVLGVLLFPGVLGNLLDNPLAGNGAEEEAWTTVTEIFIEPSWNEKSITQKFPSIPFLAEAEFDDAWYFEINIDPSAWNETVNDKYKGNYYDIVSHSPVNNSKISQPIGIGTAIGYNENDGKQTANYIVFALKDISTQCAVAVKFDDVDEYYTYVNSNYFPETLGDLITDLNLKENLVLNKFYYSYEENGENVNAEYTVNVHDKLWEMLLSSTDAMSKGYVENNDDFRIIQEYGSFSIDVKVIGHENISLSFSKIGYINTNILNTGKSFYIGEEKVNNFINYILENGDSKILSREPISFNDGSDGVKDSPSMTGADFEPDYNGAMPQGILPVDNGDEIVSNDGIAEQTSTAFSSETITKKTTTPII